MTCVFKQINCYDTHRAHFDCADLLSSKLIFPLNLTILSIFTKREYRREVFDINDLLLNFIEVKKAVPTFELVKKHNKPKSEVHSSSLSVHLRGAGALEDSKLISNAIRPERDWILFHLAQRRKRKRESAAAAGDKSLASFSQPSVGPNAQHGQLVWLPLFGPRTRSLSLFLLSIILTWQKAIT